MTTVTITDTKTLKITFRNLTTIESTLQFQRDNDQLLINEWFFFTLVINRKNGSIDVYLNDEMLSQDFAVNELATTWTWVSIGSEYSYVNIFKIIFVVVVVFSNYLK